MTKSPLEILTKYYDGLLNERPGAREYAFGLWAAGSSLSFAGSHPFSGTFPAKTWQREVYKTALMSKGMIDQKVKLYDLVGDGRFGLSHYLEVFELPDGERLEAERFCLYGFEGGQIVSMRVFDADPDSVNEFFNKHFAS